MNATWTKLRNGTWGVKVQGATRTGDLVTVAKRSGPNQDVRVGRLVWTGSGVSICTVMTPNDSARDAVRYLPSDQYGAPRRTRRPGRWARYDGDGADEMDAEAIANDCEARQAWNDDADAEMNRIVAEGERAAHAAAYASKLAAGW